jgi:hypothetical protein
LGSLAIMATPNLVAWASTQIMQVQPHGVFVDTRYMGYNAIIKTAQGS